MTEESSALPNLETLDGQSLDALCGAPMDPGRFLPLAIGITAAVADIHRQHILHKNINPATILIDSRTGTVTTADVSSVSRLP